MAFLSAGTKKVAAVDTHVQYTQTDTIRQTDGKCKYVNILLSTPLRAFQG